MGSLSPRLRAPLLVVTLLAGTAVSGLLPGLGTAMVVPGAPAASAPPEITDVAQPVVIPDQPVTITGTNLQGATRVRVGREDVSFVYTNSLKTSMRVWIPADYVNGDIIVTTPLGSAAGHIRPFRVDSISPQTSFAGGTLTVTGQGFNGLTTIWMFMPYPPQNPKSDAQVERTVDYQVQSDTQLTLTVPYEATDGVQFYADLPGVSTPMGTFHMPTASNCGCLHLVSAFPGRRTLDAQPSTANTVVANNNPHLGVWNYVFPTNSDQTHGLFQLVARNTGNQCLTEQDSTSLDRTAAPNLQRTTCSTARGSDLYMRQLWYFVQPGDTPGPQHFELVSAADGRCADASADQDNANVNTTGCTASTSQEWIALDPDDVLLNDAIQHGTILASDLATAKTAVTVNHRSTVYSALPGRRPLEMHDDLNSPWYPPTIDNANTIGHWAFGTESDSDTQNGRFTLVDERHGRNRCLTETPETYPSTPNNSQAAYPNVLMLACVEVPGSSIEARQHFVLRQVNATQFEIRSANDNRCLTVSYGADIDNAAVDIEPCVNLDRQYWNFDGTLGNDLAVPAAPNYGRLVSFYSKTDPTWSLGRYESEDTPVVMDATTQSGFKSVDRITYFNSTEQAAGYFQIIDQNSGKCLSNVDNYGLVYRDCSTTAGDTETRQEWFFTSRDNGEFWLRSKQDGTCIESFRAPSDTARGTDLETCRVNTNPTAQLWTITDIWPGDPGE